MGATTRCSHCAGPVDPGARWCPKCGAAVSWHTPTAEGQPPPGAYVLVHAPRMRVRKEALRGPVVRIGRSSDCEVVIGDPRVSRIHATLELLEGSYRLADARSTGGTFLDGRPVHEAVPLRAGAIIRLGRDEDDPVTLVYHEEDPDREAG